jgi:hypothetical protein
MRLFSLRFFGRMAKVIDYGKGSILPNASTDGLHSTHRAVLLYVKASIL